MGDPNREFAINRESLTKDITCDIFETAMNKLGLPILTPELNNYPFDVSEIDDDHFGNSRVEVDGDTTRVFLTKERSGALNPVLIEEMVHATHLSTNPNIRQKTNEFYRLRTELSRFSRIKEQDLLAAKCLLDPTETGQIIEKIESRANLIGLNYGNDFKKWLMQYISGQGTGFRDSKPEPGTVLRIYEKLFGHDDDLESLKTLFADYYFKYQTEGQTEPGYRQTYLGLIESRGFAIAEKKIVIELEKMDTNSVKILLDNIGCGNLQEIATIDYVIEAIEALGDQEAAEAIKTIINTNFSRIDLEVLAYNLDIALYKDGVKPEQYPFYKVPESKMFSDNELIDQIRSTLDRNQVSAKRALKECLLFSERTGLGNSMIKAANSLKFNDYPEGATDNSVFFGEEYQRTISDMMTKLDVDHWLNYSSQKAFFDIPLSDNSIPGVYTDKEMRPANVDRLKENILSRQNNYYYQNSSIGIGDGWRALQRLQDIVYLENGLEGIAHKTANKINEIVLKRIKLSDDQAEINMMTEPVAKLIAQLANDGTQEKIYFEEEGFLDHGYSWILTSQTEENKLFRNRLLSLLSEMIAKKDSRKLIQFLKATSFSQQLEVIGFDKLKN